MVDNKEKSCLVCKKTDEETPLVTAVYRGEPLYICSQHMPVLIHSPEKLIGTLPGAENIAPGAPD